VVLPGIKSVAALTLNNSPQIIEFGNDFLNDFAAYVIAIVEKTKQGTFEPFLVELSAKVLVLFHVIILISLIHLEKENNIQIYCFAQRISMAVVKYKTATHLHSAETNTKSCRGAGCALGNLLALFLG